MKPLLAMLAALLVCSILFQALPALSQTEFPVLYEDGVCRMREADLVKLQHIINLLVDRIQSLQDRTGCS